MKKYFIYLILPLVGLLCSAHSCDDNCAEAAEGLIFKFKGQWCVTSVETDSVADKSQHVSAYWDLRDNYTYTLCQTSNGVEATYTDGVLNTENVAWRSSSAEFEPTTNRVDLGLHKGAFHFDSPDCFILAEDGTLYTFRRIKTIK